MQSSSVSVFNYTDYRHISDYYKARKRESKAFSYRFFSEKSRN